MTLLTICQDALKRITGWEIPGSIVANTDETAEACLALVNEGGRELALFHDWQDLILTHTVTTTSGTATYALPNDFRKVAPETTWDRTNDWQMWGPQTASNWAWLQSANVTSTLRRRFAIRAGVFTVYPTPTTGGDTLVFDYYSKNWCESTSGTGKTAFTLDSDVPVLDEELHTLDLKWRFLHAKGSPYAEAKAAFVDYRDRLLTTQGKPVLQVRGHTLGPEDRFDQNVPESDYGA